MRARVAVPLGRHSYARVRVRLHRAHITNDPLNKVDPLGLRPSGPREAVGPGKGRGAGLGKPLVTCGGVGLYERDVLRQRVGEMHLELADRLVASALAGGPGAVYASVGVAGDGSRIMAYRCGDDFLDDVIAANQLRCPFFRVDASLVGIHAAQWNGDVGACGFWSTSSPCENSGVAQEIANSAAGVLSIITAGHPTAFVDQRWCGSSGWYTFGNGLGVLLMAYGAFANYAGNELAVSCLAWGYLGAAGADGAGEVALDSAIGCGAGAAAAHYSALSTNPLAACALWSGAAFLTSGNDAGAVALSCGAGAAGAATVGNPTVNFFASCALWGLASGVESWTLSSAPAGCAAGAVTYHG